MRIESSIQIFVGYSHTPGSVLKGVRERRGGGGRGKKGGSKILYLPTSH